ncbi:MAG: hypothetical protein K6F09_08950 [Clostridiales bacterium]|nr:hypothetical protein [Clostridiales bacterium]
MKKRVISAFICLLVFLSCFSFYSSAETEKASASGLYALTIGAHKLGSDIISNDVMKVTAYINGSSEGRTDNHIYDLKTGDTVVLKADFNSNYDAFYSFWGWLDNNGVILGEESTLSFTIGKSSVSCFAVYREMSDRHVITCDTHGKGSVTASDPKGFDVINGDNMISVLNGTSPVLKFKPKSKSFVVKKITVDGKNITSLSGTLSAVGSFLSKKDYSSAAKAFKNYKNATNKFIGTYQLENVTSDVTVDVVFSDNPIDIILSMDILWLMISKISGLGK